MPFIHQKVRDMGVEVRDSFESLNRYTNDGYNALYVAPSDLASATLGSHNMDQGNKFSIYVFADAADAHGAATLIPPTYWINGGLKVTIWYTQSGSNEGEDEFRIRDTIAAVGSGTALSSPTTLYANDHDVDPGVTSKIVKSYTYNVTTDWTSSFDLMAFWIGRLGTHEDDGNARDFWFLGAKIEYQPVNRQ